MTRSFALPAAALAWAAVAVAVPVATRAADNVTANNRPAAAAPGQPAPRRGDYRVLARGAHAWHVKCLEGGTVFVQAGEVAGRAAGARDAALRSACQSVDYTK